MHRFLGITLKISLSPKDASGYAACWREVPQVLEGTVIPDSVGFARRHMSFWRYKQIRSAFHPEDRDIASMNGNDKCYQLRHAINTLNKSAMNMRYIPGCVSFDEGGCMCRSRYCPVRMHNKDKPNKFRVDFFMMGEAQVPFCHHIDVYQGKNQANINIKPEIRGVPTTQKAVLNAVLQTEMDKCVDGARLIAMDNRYMCAQLCSILHSKYGIESVGTTKTNRIGWDKDKMDLTKKQPRGTSKKIIDKTNRVMSLQWVDNKVVKVISSVLSAKDEKVKRRVGSKRIDVDCPEVVVKYQKNMGGIDKIDQKRAAGGFSLKAHYKKWHKRVYFSILDIMLCNAHVVWNESAQPEHRLNRRTYDRPEFFTKIAQRFMEWPEDDNDSESLSKNLFCKPTTNEQISHVPSYISGRHKCIVCKLECSDALGGSDVGYQLIGTGVAGCTGCSIIAHSTIPKYKRKLHSFEAFQNKTCHEIIHTKEGRELWARKGPDEPGRNYMPQVSHPHYKQLRTLYGKPEVIARPGRKKRKTTEGETDDDATTVN